MPGSVVYKCNSVIILVADRRRKNRALFVNIPFPQRRRCPLAVPSPDAVAAARPRALVAREARVVDKSTVTRGGRGLARHVRGRRLRRRRGDVRRVDVLVVQIVRVDGADELPACFFHVVEVVPPS